jgi:DNA topoisomerase IB
MSLTARLAAKYKDKKKTDKGGTVYLYSDKQIEHRNREKAKRIEKLRGKIGELRAKVKRDLRSDDPETKLTALAVALMDETYERVGNEESADDGHFGVTGWQKSHVTFGKGRAKLKYVGKAGVKHDKQVTDKAILTALRRGGGRGHLRLGGRQGHRGQSEQLPQEVHDHRQGHPRLPRQQ